jgi:hypothetical protein
LQIFPDEMTDNIRVIGWRARIVRVSSPALLATVQIFTSELFT